MILWTAPFRPFRQNNPDTLFALTVCAAVIGAGCRAHPVSLALTLAGDVVDRQELAEREPLLVGEPASAADVMFGPRHDTLIDRGCGRKWLVYAEPGEKWAESYYVAQTDAGDRIGNLFKVKRNIDGLEDLYTIREMSRKIVGADRPECERVAGLHEPLHHFYSTATGYDAFFYDVRNLSHTRGARYCILCFDPRGLCWEVRQVGVTAD